MTKRVIEHEIKLQKSVIVILAVLAIGVCANALPSEKSVLYKIPIKPILYGL